MPQLAATDPVTIGTRAALLECQSVDNLIIAAANQLIANQAAIASHAGVTITTITPLVALTETQTKAAIGGLIAAGTANS